MELMMKKPKLLTVMLVLPMLFFSVKANAVRVSASFAFSVARLMDHFFATYPVMIIDSYSDANEQSHPLPGGSISIDDDHQTTTSVLDLGDVNPGQTFFIRFDGEYFALNRMEGGQPHVPIPARLKLVFRLVEQQGTYRLQLQRVLGRNRPDLLPPESQIRAIEPSITGGVVGPNQINSGQRLRISLDFEAANAVMPGLLMNQLL